MHMKSLPNCLPELHKIIYKYWQHICSSYFYSSHGIGLPLWLSKESRHAGDLGSIPGLERSPGEGKGYPLQYSGLENSMGVSELDTTERLSLHFNPFYCETHTLGASQFPRPSYLEICLSWEKDEDREPAGLWVLSRVTKLGRENSCSPHS